MAWALSHCWCTARDKHPQQSASGDELCRNRKLSTAAGWIGPGGLGGEAGSEVIRIQLRCRARESESDTLSGVTACGSLGCGVLLSTCRSQPMRVRRTSRANLDTR